MKLGQQEKRLCHCFPHFFVRYKSQNLGIFLGKPGSEALKDGELSYWSLFGQFSCCHTCVADMTVALVGLVSHKHQSPLNEMKFGISY